MATKKSGPDSLLAPNKPEAKQLNKKLILSIAGIVAIVLLLIISMAFSGAPTKKANNTITVPQSVNADTSAVNQLPSGYQDAQAIKGYMNRNQPKSDDSALLKQLNELRQQQAQLQQQLSQLQQHPAQQQVNYNDPMQREAMTSSIFFAGGAPAAQNQNQQAATPADQKKTDQAQKPAGAADPYAAQNAQGQKADFLNSKPSKDIYNTNGVQYPISQYELQAGTVIPAILQTQLNSDLPGMIVAVVRQNVYDSINGQYLIIPKGSKLIGEYSSSISYGQSALQAKFTRLIRPDGSSVVLPSATGGVDNNGVSGLADEVNNHWGAIIGAGILMAVFNIPSIIATNQMNSSSSSSCYTNSSGQQVCTPSNSSTLSASAWQSVGQATANLGSSIAQRSLNIQPTIIINSGYEFSVLVSKDIVLPPYQPVMENIPNLAN